MSFPKFWFKLIAIASIFTFIPISGFMPFSGMSSINPRPFGQEEIPTETAILAATPTETLMAIPTLDSTQSETPTPEPSSTLPILETPTVTATAIPTETPTVTVSTTPTETLFGTPTQTPTMTATPSRQTSDNLYYKLGAGGYSFQLLPDGTEILTVDGYMMSGKPGDPALPSRSISYALPPDADPGSLVIEITSSNKMELDGIHNIVPVEPAYGYIDGQTLVDWGDNAAYIVDGRNSRVYGVDTFFPDVAVQYNPAGLVRQWRYVTITYTPVQYNPVTGKVILLTDATLRIGYDRGASAASSSAMDAEAAQFFENFDEAQQWYPLAAAQDYGASAGYTYAIITTNAIRDNSSQLANFIASKTARGYSVQVVTETNYGSLTGLSPNGTADKIRQWLINNYNSLNIKYVLLIGNPNPSTGDVPMKIGVIIVSW